MPVNNDCCLVCLGCINGDFTVPPQPAVTVSGASRSDVNGTYTFSEAVAATLPTGSGTPPTGSCQWEFVGPPSPFGGNHKVYLWYEKATKTFDCGITEVDDPGYNGLYGNGPDFTISPPTKASGSMHCVAGVLTGTLIVPTRGSPFDTSTPTVVFG